MSPSTPIRVARWNLLAIAALATALTGCGSQGTVSGKVYYEDKIVPAGSVVIVSGGKTLSGVIDKDGKYKVENVPTGEAKVAVTVPQAPKGVKFSGPPKGIKFGPPKGVELPPGVDPKMFNPESGLPPNMPKIPEALTDPEKSGYKITVTSGEQTHDIKLK